MTPLDNLARRMITFANLNPWSSGKPIRTYRRKLGNLTFEYYWSRVAGAWTLAVARIAPAPSQAERAAIRAAFGVPADVAEPEAYDADGLQIVKYVWSPRKETA